MVLGAGRYDMVRFAGSGNHLLLIRHHTRTHHVALGEGGPSPTEPAQPNNTDVSA